jgi:hypothetical protein
MGLGACAFQTDGYTHFTSIKSIKKAGGSIEVICSIDMKLELKILGTNSKVFTRAQEFMGTNIYMKHEKRQEQLLRLGALLRKVFNVKVCFVKVPPMGEVRIRYELGNNEIAVDLSCETEKTGCKLFVMNELGGSIFDKSIVGGELSASPSGWQKMVSACELYSSAHSLAFTILEKQVPDNVRSKLYWGREHIVNSCCWAGFESEIRFDSSNFEHYTYSVRFRSLDKVFEEIRDIVSYGYDSLWIADDLFTCDAQFLKSFCSRLIAEDLKITWSCLSRVDSVTDEAVKVMKSAGCSKVHFGIESGNDHVLKLMNKKIDTAKVTRTVEMFKSNGLGCAGFFIVGYPGETVATIEETFDFALSLGLDEISFNVPYPLPGSKLYERVSDISEDDWTFENETRFLYKSEFDEKWLKKRIQETQETFAGLEKTR